RAMEDPAAGALPSWPLSPGVGPATAPQNADAGRPPEPLDGDPERAPGPGQVPRSPSPGDDNRGSGWQANRPTTPGSPRHVAGDPTGRTTDMLGDPQNYLAVI